MTAWIVQVDRRTGLAKARSCGESCFAVRCEGLGDSFAGPYFLVVCDRDPSGLPEDVVMDMPGPIVGPGDG